MLHSVAIFSFLLLTAFCELGIVFGPDVFGSSTIKCAIQSGYNYVAWMTPSTSNGISKSFTSNALQNMKNAGAKTQLIFVPCKSRDPAQQALDFAQRISKDLYQRVWLFGNDISEEGPCRWKFSVDTQNSCKLFLSFLNEFKKNNINIGMMSNQMFLDNMFDCQVYNDFSLFWMPENPDGKPSFSDFSPFGGWSKPAKKVYVEQATVCGMDVGLSYQS